jgi:hypothetical protein
MVLFCILLFCLKNLVKDSFFSQNRGQNIHEYENLETKSERHVFTVITTTTTKITFLVQNLINSKLLVISMHINLMVIKVIPIFFDMMKFWL